jgi:hypothetical protein
MDCQPAAGRGHDLQLLQVLLHLVRSYHKLNHGKSLTPPIPVNPPRHPQGMRPVRAALPHGGAWLEAPAEAKINRQGGVLDGKVHRVRGLRL